jgi:hypothetical protein
MKTFWTLAIGALFSLSLAPESGAAPQFGRGRDRDEGRDRVCLYQDIQYQGWEQCYSNGDEIPSLGGRSNAASSIRVFGRTRVTVYEDSNFRGRSAEFSSDVPDLGRRIVSGSRSWSDHIQSLRVGFDYDSRDNRGVFGGGFPDRFPRNQIDDGICVYERHNYDGRSQCWRAGENLNDLGRAGNWSDRIASIQVFGRAVAILYRDIGFRGQSITIDRDIPDLGRVSAQGFDDWDRQASSVRIEFERGRGRGRF